MTYTVYKIEIDGQTLSHKEHLNSIDEVNTWLVHNKFNNVLVVQDQTGKQKRMYRVEENIYVEA